MGYESRACRIDPAANALIAVHRYVNTKFGKDQGSVSLFKVSEFAGPLRPEQDEKMLRGALEHARGVVLLDQGVEMDRVSINGPANPEVRHLVD